MPPHIRTAKPRSDQLTLNEFMGACLGVRWRVRLDVGWPRRQVLADAAHFWDRWQAELLVDADDRWERCHDVTSWLVRQFETDVEWQARILATDIADLSEFLAVHGERLSHDVWADCHARLDGFRDRLTAIEAGRPVPFVPSNPSARRACRGGVDGVHVDWGRL
jgi:hypothetical protein